MLRAIYASIKVPEFIANNSETINDKLSLISLIGLSALAFYNRPQHFMVAIGLGAAWQVASIVLKVKRSDKGDHCNTEMGCVDGYSKWFIGENPKRFETIVGGTWLAAEHIVHHSKVITFSNFLGVCMGIRAMLAVRNFFTAQPTPRPPEVTSFNARTAASPSCHVHTH